jgi:hypothetical protein
MSFELSRDSRSAPAEEVQRWQGFLLRQGLALGGGVDGVFGQNTELATKAFQTNLGIAATGALDAATLAEASKLGLRQKPPGHHALLREPPLPADFGSPGPRWRDRNLGCFAFHQPPPDQRGDDRDRIVIEASCDGAAADWAAASLVSVDIPQLRLLGFGNGKVMFHRAGANALRALWAAWEATELLHLILTFHGTFSARYSRDRSPSYVEGHGRKLSREVPALSNHAFGSAFDINRKWNDFDKPPAAAGQPGCVWELVPIAHQNGFFWGGHFSTRKDGMHFELARLSPG